MPSHFIAPSLLDQRYFSNSEYIPVPVDVKWKYRTTANTFVHNAGHFGLQGRNGTRELVEAMKLVTSPAQLLLRCQESPPFLIPPLPNITLQIGNVPYESLWDEGDVFIFPEKFNGLSLPLQEARAAGMLIIATDRFPMNTWLPTEYLIKPETTYRTNIGGSYLDFEESIISSKSIAETIDKVYGQCIADYSIAGNAWGNSMSWERLGQRWLSALQRICNEGVHK
jgi:hypothetical protein